MGKTATALVAQALHGPLRLQDVQLDDLRPDEVLIEIHAVGICHADVSCLHGTIPVSFPNVFGHEGAGIVKAIGSAVRDVQPSDTVLISYNSCGQCKMCKQTQPAYCMKMLKLNFAGIRLDGSHPIRAADGSPLFSNFFGQSSFSSLAVVNSRCVVKVPDETDLKLFAPLGCGIQTGTGAVLNTLNVQQGDSVAIFGTGSVGMAAIMAAKIRKAKTIIGIDLNKGRLEIAKTIGATDVLDGSSGNIADQIKTICSGDGVMHAIDATGVGVVIETMIDSLGTRGRAVTIGAPSPGTQVKVDVFLHLTMGKQYVGSNQGDCVPQKMIPYLIDQHSRGNLPLEKIISIYDMSDYETAFEDMRLGKVIKPVLVWKH